MDFHELEGTTLESRLSKLVIVAAKKGEVHVSTHIASQLIWQVHVETTTVHRVKVCSQSAARGQGHKAL